MFQNTCSRLGIFRYVLQFLHFFLSNYRVLTNIHQTTVNLKKVELPVKQIVSGKKIKPSGTLANPESLKFYEQFADVENVVRRMTNEKKSYRRSTL
jgi:hypothetical protein